jgi:hypothetical protein
MATVSGGDKITKYLHQIVEKASSAGSVTVGFHEDGPAYPDGTPPAQVAAMVEYGAATAPPRPALRNMISNKSPDWAPTATKLLQANNYDTHKTLDQMGALIAGEFVEAVKEGYPPANAPSTIAKKGFDKPWTDTGHLANSVTWKVK